MREVVAKHGNKNAAKFLLKLCLLVVEPTHGMFTSFILNDGHARAKAWIIYTKNGGMVINLVGNIGEYEGFIMIHPLNSRISLDKQIADLSIHP